MDNRDFKDKYVNPYTDFGFCLSASLIACFMAGKW